MSGGRAPYTTGPPYIEPEVLGPPPPPVQGPPMPAEMTDAAQTSPAEARDTPPLDTVAEDDPAFVGPPMPSEMAAATCTADLKITIEEPLATGVPGNRMQGFSWIGVDGVTVKLTKGADTFEVVTAGGGVASFSALECGLYAISLSQDEFRITNLGDGQVNVSSTAKNGGETERKIKRQLMTMEMFRLGTQLLAAAGLTQGNGTDDTYGHWWTKIYASEADAQVENASQSYGWWPAAGAIGADDGPLRDTITGVRGVLNGYDPGNPYGSYGGTATTDPYHTKSRTYPNLDDVFFPFVTDGKTAAQYKSELAALAQAFSSDVSDRWAWRTDGGGWHCKSFQAYLMRNTSVWKRLGARNWSGGWSVRID